MKKLGVMPSFFFVEKYFHFFKTFLRKLLDTPHNVWYNIHVIKRRAHRRKERGTTMKKYYYRVIAQDGTILMEKKSDYAYRLLKADEKEFTDDSGATYCCRYNATVETNIPDEVMYRVSCGEKIQGGSPMKMTVSNFQTNLILGGISIIEGADLVSTRCVRTDALPLGAALIQFRTSKMYALQCGTTMYTCDQREAKRILFSLRLRELADASGMTQVDFAEALGIPLRTLESYLAGVRTPAPFTQTALLEAAEKIVKEN